MCVSSTDPYIVGKNSIKEKYRIKSSLETLKVPILKVLRYSDIQPGDPYNRKEIPRGFDTSTKAFRNRQKGVKL